MEGWHFVDVTGDEYVCTVQAGDGTFQLKVGANLRDVNGVAIVGRVGNVLGPCVGNLRRYASSRTQPKRSQQPVITRGRTRLSVRDTAEAPERSREVNTVRRIVGRAQRGIATSDSTRRRDYLRRRRRIDVDRSN